MGVRPECGCSAWQPPLPGVGSARGQLLLGLMSVRFVLVVTSVKKHFLNLVGRLIKVWIQRVPSQRNRSNPQQATELEVLPGGAVIALVAPPRSTTP